MEKLHFEGTDLIIDAESLSPDLLQDLIDCGGPGDATEAVEYVIRSYSVTGNPDDCAAYLKGYGAWEDSDLEDHDENLMRLVWLAGCSLREGESAYFSTYA